VIGHCSPASILIGCSENLNFVFFSLRRRGMIRKMGGYMKEEQDEQTKNKRK
jgi:hypothetical protein